MFFKQCVFNNFATFTGEHLCWSLRLIKLQVSRLATLLKRESGAGVFLWIFRIFWRTHFFTEHLRLLLLFCLYWLMHHFINEAVKLTHISPLTLRVHWKLIYIKQIFSCHLQVCLSMYKLLVNTRWYRPQF